MLVDFSSVSNAANAYWRSRSAHCATPKGQCSLCDNDAVYYDSASVGYCLGHWQGISLAPGVECAEKMCKSFGGREPEIFWVTGTQIIDPELWPYTLKGLENLDTIHTLRPSCGRVVRSLKSNLLPIRKGMPPIKLYTFAEVF